MGRKPPCKPEYGDATKVSLRMEVDTDESEPDPLLDMPRRTDYGDEIHDDRVYQDDMNIWKEQKLDHSTQEKEYKKQRREFSKKLKQIKNSLLSTCVLDVREHLENTHSPMVAAYLHPEEPNLKNHREAIYLLR